MALANGDSLEPSDELKSAETALEAKVGKVETALEAKIDKTETALQKDINDLRLEIRAEIREANLGLILEACRTYADLGCAAVSVTGPYYYKVSQESIEHFFRELARQSPIDILLYNIPQFSNEISLPVVTRLALDCPRIVGI